MVSIFKYLTNKSYRTKLDKIDKPSTYTVKGFSYNKLNPEMQGRQTLPSKQEQEQKKGGTSLDTKNRVVRIRQYKELYKNDALAYRGVKTRNDEVVSRGFETKIKGGETPIGIQAKTLLDAVIDENGLKWSKTRQLGINTDICGDGFFELFKSTDPKELAKPSKGWKLIVLDPETIDFARHNDGKIKIDKNPLSQKFGSPEGFVYIEDPDQTWKVKPIDFKRIIHNVFDQIGGEMIGTSILQPIYALSERVMNVDHGFAESAYRVGYPQRTIGVGTETDGATDSQMQDAEEVAKQLATNDIIIYDRSKYKIDTLQTQSIDPGTSLNYFQNNKLIVFGIPKYQLTGSAQGEGNRAVAETMAKDRASMTNTMQLSIKDCYENQLFRRILDHEGYSDVVIEMVWNPIIEEDKDSEIDNILKLKNAGVISVLEARSLLSDFLAITKTDISGLPPPTPQQGFQSNPFQSFNSVKSVSLMLSQMTETNKAERNRIANFDFRRVEDEMSQFKNSLNEFYEGMRRRLAAQYEQSKSIIEENLALDSIKPIIIGHLSKIYNTGYSQGIMKVGNKRKKKLADNVIPADIMANIEIYATTLALKESSDLINAVNMQISLGLSAGESIPQIKKRISNAFEKYGGTTGRFAEFGTRAELIARTEAIRIANSARLDAYKDAGVQRYEWLAALDERTDDECFALNGRIFNTGEGPLPITGTHPNCRCTIIPVV